MGPNYESERKISALFKAMPKAVSLDGNGIEISPLQAEGGELVTFRPKEAHVVPGEWVKTNKAAITRHLARHGALLFRGFGLRSADSFRQFMESLGGGAMEYQHRSSPRTQVVDTVYTSTDHPPDQYINMHNELSYSPSWPMKIAFFCAVAPGEGGQTPIADSRRVLNHLGSRTRAAFLEKGVLYERNVGVGLGLPWQEVFQTTSRAAVEADCRVHGMDFAWKEGDRLLLRWRKPAIVAHPLTGEQVWFNHAFFFNRWALDKLIHATLTPEELPFNTYYGDGSEIDPDTIEEIRAAFEQAKCTFAWQPGDLLLLDNMMVAHGRNPFRGDRKILVAMSEPCT